MSEPIEGRADADETVDAPERSRRPDWFHRDHPVFFPLAGFFTGMASIIVVPGLYGAILKGLLGTDRAEELFPFVLLLLVVPIGMLVPHHTRRFAKYMLIGMLGTILVVGGVAAAVLWFLLEKNA